MQVSRKQKTFSQFCAAFLKASLNFEHFFKKGDPHSWCTSEITDSENMVTLVSKNPVSRDTSGSNMVNASKHCWNLDGRFSTIFIDRSEGNWHSKSLF